MLDGEAEERAGALTSGSGQLCRRPLCTFAAAATGSSGVQLQHCIHGGPTNREVVSKHYNRPNINAIAINTASEQ